MATADIIWIGDKSGSMNTIREAAIEAFNKLLEEQKSTPGECAFTMVLFNDRYSMPITRQPIANVPPLDMTTYVPEGYTALYDAIGKTLTLARKWDSPTPNHKYIVWITTDGAENYSREFSGEAVRKMIEELTAAGWLFIYTGATADTFAAAASIGVRAQNTMQFNATDTGYRTMTESVSSAMMSVRQAPDGDKPPTTDGWLQSQPPAVSTDHADRNAAKPDDDPRV